MVEGVTKTSSTRHQCETLWTSSRTVRQFQRRCGHSDSCYPCHLQLLPRHHSSLRTWRHGPSGRSLEVENSRVVHDTGCDLESYTLFRWSKVLSVSYSVFHLFVPTTLDVRLTRPGTQSFSTDIYGFTNLVKRRESVTLGLVYNFSLVKVGHPFYFKTSSNYRRKNDNPSGSVSSILLTRSGKSVIVSWEFILKPLFWGKV